MLAQVAKQYFKYILCKLPAASCVLLSAYIVLANAKVSEDSDVRAAYLNELKTINLEIPSSLPAVNQAAVDAAVEMYAVDVPADTQAPQFDIDLFDRGLTSGNLLGQQKMIGIGPAAFTSWGILGSTLGHEAEVHARQSFFKIVASDKWFQFKNSVKALLSPETTAIAADVRLTDGAVSEGTLAAEREAYLFEIDGAERFGLTHREVKAIRHIMNTYYK